MFLSLIASRRTTGIVRDSGDGVSLLFVDYAPASYHPRLYLADHTEYLMQNLTEREYSFFTTVTCVIVRVVQKRHTFPRHLARHLKAQDLTLDESALVDLMSQ